MNARRRGLEHRVSDQYAMSQTPRRNSMAIAALLAARLFGIDSAAAHMAETPKENVMANENNEASKATPLGRLTGVAAETGQLLEVNDHLWVSKDISDSILVTSREGNVIINTGMIGNGDQHRERFSSVSDGKTHTIVITQCHGDHFGGAYELSDADTQIVTHENYQQCREYWRELAVFYKRRSSKLWASVLGERGNVQDKLREVTADKTFKEEHSFELGGRIFELYSAPGGESQDGVIVWLPQDRTLISGNLFGPVFGNMPNLYTIRGDKNRSAKAFIESLDNVRAFKPEVIVTGHEVIRGAQQIDRILQDVRAAVMHIYQYTIDGMNAGKDVHTLMREVQLPEDLEVGQAHGKLSWCVRAIWEEYAGWFHYDATTSLYPIPASAVAGDVVELAGNDALISRANKYLESEQALEALHLINMVLSAQPRSSDALQAKIAAHEILLKQAGGENFSEVMWLKSEIEEAQQTLESIQD